MLNIHKKKLLIITMAVLLQPYFFSGCNSGSNAGNNSIAKDSATIAAGENIFNKNCSGCHNFRLDGIGPQLGGVTAARSIDWLRQFIKNPKQAIDSGDEHAKQLFNKYKTIMPSYVGLKDEELNAVIAFLDIHKAPDQQTAGGNELSNPIPDSITQSNLVVSLKPFVQIPASSDKAPLARITKLDFQPKTGNIFIVDLRGKLYQLQHNKPVLYMDMAKLKPTFIDQPGFATGFGSFAFHPDFFQNGLLYTTHTEAPNSAKADFGYADSIKVTMQWVLTEWKTNNPGEATFSGKSRELLRINMVANIHGVQEITFNPLSKPGDEDFGMLYIGVGDGGSVENGYPFLVHSTDKVWGTILRIDPMGSNSINHQYGIPLHNPFANAENKETVKEIYAYGFRNPHRITWSMSGKMLACNIGQHNIESLNLIMPGHDYGWPIREGSFVVEPYENVNKVYPLAKNDSIYKITYPVAQYDHDEGNAISGGFEYESSDIPQLKGKFLFGDIPSGRLFYVDVTDLKQGSQARIKEWSVSMDHNIRTLKEICKNDRVDLHFGRDSKGELYILTKADGKVYKLSGATMKP